MRVDFRHCQVLDPVGDAVAFPKSYGILERPAHFSDLAGRSIFSSRQQLTRSRGTIAGSGEAFSTMSDFGPGMRRRSLLPSIQKTGALRPAHYDRRIGVQATELVLESHLALINAC
jgi:hypothetical protein